MKTFHYSEKAFDYYGNHHLVKCIYQNVFSSHVGYYCKSEINDDFITYFFYFCGSELQLFI